MTDTDQNYDLCAITVTSERLSLATVSSNVGTIFVNTTTTQGILQNAAFSCTIICPAS